MPGNAGPVWIASKLWEALFSNPFCLQALACRCGGGLKALYMSAYTRFYRSTWHFKQRHSAPWASVHRKPGFPNTRGTMCNNHNHNDQCPANMCIYICMHKYIYIYISMYTYIYMYMYMCI